MRQKTLVAYSPEEFDELVNRFVSTLEQAGDTIVQIAPFEPISFQDNTGAVLCIYQATVYYDESD